MEYKGSVPGKDKGKIMLYALSTCIWCKRTKELLDSLGVSYDYLYVDLVEEEEEREKITQEIKNWNPRSSFPTIVMNNESCMIGFDEEQLMKELGQ